MPNFCLTREKHLDHMVRVVPFIVGAYALNCYMILQLGQADLLVNALLFLGAGLVLMISGFITYDLKHQVQFHESFLTISFSPFFYEKKLTYNEIKTVVAGEADQSFTTLTITTTNGKKYGFYFVDDAAKIIQWLEEKRQTHLQEAA